MNISQEDLCISDNESSNHINFQFEFRLYEEDQYNTFKYDELNKCKLKDDDNKDKLKQQSNKKLHLQKPFFQEDQSTQYSSETFPNEISQPLNQENPSSSIQANCSYILESNENVYSYQKDFDGFKQQDLQQQQQSVEQKQKIQNKQVEEIKKKPIQKRKYIKKEIYCQENETTKNVIKVFMNKLPQIMIEYFTQIGDRQNKELIKQFQVKHKNIMTKLDVKQFFALSQKIRQLSFKYLTKGALLKIAQSKKCLTKKSNLKYLDVLIMGLMDPNSFTSIKQVDISKKNKKLLKNEQKLEQEQPCSQISDLQQQNQNFDFEQLGLNQQQSQQINIYNYKTEEFENNNLSQWLHENNVQNNGVLENRNIKNNFDYDFQNTYQFQQQDAIENYFIN
ncbi:hypothetical protein PPERSA_00866 [Pseudocohnilembus persalinus]|uniref:Uncharacterized protein n=1 Tax=Pseudocohnilembus persalinus TaxID=266149 RepID=A0A0V0QEP6_PSEPJ|nr:hypothetical protein PPERSA_00866 [Pseudocohnilembus persalinus]|eukprot:KRX00639.1 hypothetical protein PPERSA_00866 [Pseudocohnilembus persalinus]